MKIWSWRHAIQTADIPSVTKLVLLNLSIYHNDRGEGFWPSYERQAMDTGLSRRSVIEHIQKAVDLGFLEKNHEMRDNGSASSNRYFPCIPNAMVVNEIHQGVQGVQEVHGVVQEDNHPSESPALGVVNEVHPHIESNKILSIDNNIPPIIPHSKSNLIPDWVPKADWDDFCEMRKRRGKPPTARAIQLLVKDLEKFRARGSPPDKVLQESIKNGWLGFYELKEKQGNSKENRNGKLSYSDTMLAGLQANLERAETLKTASLAISYGQTNSS